eukprot:987350_1
MSSHSRKRRSISLMRLLWLMIFIFTFILFFFGIKVKDIHETILRSDAYALQQQYQHHPNTNQVRSFRLLSDVLKAPTPEDSDVSITHLPSPSPRIIKPQKESCQWYPPYDQLHSYPQFDMWFRKLNFDRQKAIKYITRLSNKYCTTFTQGYVFTFASHDDDGAEDEAMDDALHIAIATVIMLPKRNNKTRFQSEKDGKISIFKDIRTYILRIENALRYAQKHGYALIILTKPMFKYRYAREDNNKLLRRKYNEWMKGATFQKPFLIAKYLSDFDWILWVDYDTIFLNCENKAEDVINYAHFVHPHHDQISLIFGGERFSTINAGVWFIKNTEWSHQFLADWMYIEENAEQFEILKADDVHKDQPLFVALLQGFDVDQDITRFTFKDLKYHNKLAQKKYLTRKLRLDFEDMLERPIWDEHIAQFAVPIDEAIINAKTEHFNMGKADQLDLDIKYLYVMHFYWSLKYKKK